MSRDEPPGGAGGSGAGGSGAGGSGAGGSSGGEKADRHMRRALDDAAPEDELQAIVTVKGAVPSTGAAGSGAPAGGEEPPAPPHPQDYPDRVAYRQAMIEHHGQNPRERVGAAKEALEKLGLTTRGEGHAGLLVVRGPARCLADALELEAVDRAALDRHVEPRGAEERELEDEPGGEDRDALGLPPGGRGSEG